MRLTQDHKPRVQAEKERIIAAGGTITEMADGNLRVGGKLDMTRSIGDVELKAIGVTAEPETRSIEVSAVLNYSELMQTFSLFKSYLFILKIRM